MSFSSLQIAASSLYASQRAAEVAAHNVANANTPGYTRQRLSVDSAVPTPGTPGIRGDGMRGTGVTVLSVDRLRDLLSDLSVRAEAGSSAGADLRTQVLGRAEGVLGAYPDGASAALDRFFASWDQLSLSPQDPAARAAVLNAGREVAESLGSAAGQLDQLTRDLGRDMSASVDEVNDLAGRVADLNARITDALAKGAAPNDLLDQRDVALDRLAALTGATSRAGSAPGQVDVHVGGAALVAGLVTRPLTATRSATGVPGVAFVDGPATVGGELGAAVRVLSVDLPQFSAQLDDVAARLASDVNAVHATAYSLDSGGPGTSPDGGAFFTGTDARSIAVRAGLTERGIAVSASGAKTDGNAALTLSGLRSAGDPTLGDLVRGLTGRLGAAAAAANREAAAASAGLSAATAQRDAANGVNVDEEMVDLVKYQHSYEAAARVISIADGFLDTIINRMGAGR